MGHAVASRVASSERSSLIRPFYPGLDGLRTIAFILVFAIHYGPLAVDLPIFRWGWVGVDLFFVLSGFLITGILFDSLSKPNFFRTFYIRRSLRIFPLFFGFWVVLLLLTPVVHIVWNRYVVTMAAYLGNFFLPGSILGLHPSPGAISYGSLNRPQGHSFISADHLWSLCVEEQFYLVWPAVVWLVRSRRALLRICLAVIVLLPIGRMIVLSFHPQRVVDSGVLYYNTFARVDTLLFGAAIALWLRGPCPSAASLRRLSLAAVFAGPILLAALLALVHRFSLVAASTTAPSMDPVVSTIGYTLIGAAAAGILLLTIDPECPLSRLLQWPPLVFLGRLSYGMYFFHELPWRYLYFFSQRLAPRHLSFLAPLLAFVVAVALAWLSFRFFESPFLRLKSRLAPSTGHVADPPPA